MTYRNHFALVGAFFLLITAVTAADKPNVVFILADELGYGDL